jgi:hypothetical protein
MEPVLSEKQISKWPDLGGKVSLSKLFKDLHFKGSGRAGRVQIKISFRYEKYRIEL